MNCPVCNRATRVLQTRERKDRQRECSQGHRFWTREVVRKAPGNGAHVENLK
jgi:transcriptional regulator NrdR family protein